MDEDDVIKQAILKDLLVKQQLVVHPIGKEIADYIERQSSKTERPTTDLRLALELLQSVTGNISVNSITVDHWRQFFDKVNASELAPRTRYNRWKLAKGFLRSLQVDHDLNWTWLENRKYSFQMPQGNKIQWTFEQVRIALDNATGITKTALLLGLNFGWYVGDIAQFVPNHFDGLRVNKARQKLHKDEDAMICSHLCWKETQDAFQHGLLQSSIAKAFQAFAKQYQLPVHKALRKTVSQWIDDYCGEEAARLYRGERASGNHGKFYIRLTEPQKQKLDSALNMVHGILFDNHFPDNWQG